ncbi:oligopeptide transporter [Apiospora hydei]|uniref:Oligopeptide transporter n=1 Tax=Apiospora hydei TaxID=1337664 RepID=A0ABR1XCQ3_9PEZI
MSADAELPRTPSAAAAAAAAASGDDVHDLDDYHRPPSQHRHPAPTTTMAPPVAKVLPEGRHFTARGVGVGLAVGLVICFSNMYFGLQSGWVSMMTMPASLMGFGMFRVLAPHLKFPFSPVENVLVQSVAGGMAIMPLGCGFVGVMPALNYLLSEEEQGPVFLPMWEADRMVFGLVLLRRRVCCASSQNGAALDPSKAATFGSLALENRPLMENEDANDDDDVRTLVDGESQAKPEESYSWGANIRLLLLSFAVSGFYTLLTYFFPILRSLPIFGVHAATTWLWDLNPSLAYVGQGIIMGPATTIHMLIGAIVGWGILSPLAHNRGWAPGPISDWESGSKGWIVWISLAIMLADSVISLGYVAFRPVIQNGPAFVRESIERYNQGGIQNVFRSKHRGPRYSALNSDEADPRTSTGRRSSTSELLPNPIFDGQDEELRTWDEDDAPPEQLVGSKTVSIGLVVSILVCVASIHITFGDLVPLYANVIAILMALVLSIMGVRALGETDLNPVSGISKLAQLFFALIIPQSNKSSVLINLVAGAVSEAGALQAGDLMQDLKTGHLLGAAPKAQFWGKSSGRLWVLCLCLDLHGAAGDGAGAAPMAREWAIGAAVVFGFFTMLRTKGMGKWWQVYVPGGIAVAVGMYNVPSFTLARTIGGISSWFWRSILKKQDTPLIVLASSGKAPHL